jgi:hypothetical protein
MRSPWSERVGWERLLWMETLDSVQRPLRLPWYAARHTKFISCVAHQIIA